MTAPSNSLASPLSFQFYTEQFGPLQFIFTTRGLIVLIFVLLLLSGPAFNQSDIVATVFGFSFLSILAVLFLITVTQGLLIKRSLELSLGIPHAADSREQNQLFTDKPVRIFIDLKRATLPPFFYLQLAVEFEHTGPRKSIHRLSGRFTANSKIHEDLLFPHRGYWQVRKISISFGDQLGFSVLKWTVLHDHQAGAVRIQPRPVFYETLPILSSCQRSGDTISDTNQAEGDPYELKPYQPADGMRKIVWKIFARSGQLIARHPERAMTPEGQVLIFCLADHKEDHVAGAVISYLQKLEELNLEIFVACQGQSGQDIATTRSSAEELLIESVWNAKQAKLSNLRLDLAQLTDAAAQRLPGSRIEKIIFFLSLSRLRSERELQDIVALGDYLESMQMKPFFILVRGQNDVLSDQRSSPQKRSTLRHLLHRITKVLNYSPDSAYQDGDSSYPSFMNVCISKNWDAIMV